MNTLSIYIYLANVLLTIDTVFSILLVIGGLIILFFLCLSVGGSEEGHESLQKAMKRVFYTMIVLGLFVILIPSKQTMMLIAASEVSEMAVNSETGKEILAEVREKIINERNGE